SGALNGTYTGPNGSGSFTSQLSSNGDVTVLCGSYAGSSSGVWNLVEGSGGTLTGSYTDANGGGGGVVGGSPSGGRRPLDYAGGTADGVLSGTSASGTWSAGNLSGTWTGSAGSCP